MIHKTTHLALSSAIFMLSACTTPSTTGTTPSNTAQSISTETSTTHHINSKITAKQALQAVLQLADDLKDFKDLGLAQIQKSTNIQLNITDDSAYMPSTDYWGKITDDWSYKMLFYTTKGEEAFGFRFSSFDKEIPYTEVCEIDLDHFHAEILQIGYQHVGNFRRNLLGRQYERGNVKVSILYVGESEKNAKHDCIQSIEIWKGRVKP